MSTETWDCGCPFMGQHGLDCALNLPADESPWKTLSRERWDADYGAGDYDRIIASTKSKASA